MSEQLPNEELQSYSKPTLFLLMAASLCIAVPLAYFLNIRFDEAFTLETTLGGPIDAAKRAVGFGQQAPLYFILISIWRSIDPSIFFARLFSVMCFPLIIWTAAEVSRRYVRELNPLWAALIVLVHQQVVWNALDIRLYAVMTLLSGVLLLLFNQAYLSRVSNWRWRAAFTIAAVVSLYTQYYLGFMLAGFSVALLASGRWRELARYIVDMTIAGVLFLPMVAVLVSGQMATVSGHTEAALGFGALVNNTYQQAVSLLIAVNAVEAEFLKRWLARAAVAVVGVLFVWRLIRERDSRDITLASMTAVSVAFFALAMYLVGEQLTRQRHISFLILPMVMIGLSAFSVFRSRIPVIAWILLSVSLSGLYLWNAYRPLAKPGDFERTAMYVMANEQPNEPVLIFHADAILPFKYYYKGPNKLVALPQENGTDAWDPRNNVLKDESSILARIKTAAGDAQTLWLMHDGWCAQGSIEFNCGLLEKVIAEHFVVESTERFLDPTTVRKLRGR